MSACDRGVRSTRHPDPGTRDLPGSGVESWSDAVASAIRLGGDVDTLGAITGALMGARLGAGAIPEHLVEGVVDAERLRVLAARYHALVVSRAYSPS